jgi:hypothetical protein
LSDGLTTRVDSAQMIWLGAHSRWPCPSLSVMLFIGSADAVRRLIAA